MVEDKIRRLRRWDDEGWAPPFAVELNPTYLCNLRCEFCAGSSYGVTSTPRSDELSDEECLSIVDQAGAMGVGSVYLAGDGEPLVRRALSEKLVVRVKSRGMEGHVTTNGTLLGPELNETMVGLGWDQVNLSIDGYDEATYEGVTGVAGSFGRLMGNLEDLARRKRRARRLKPFLHINTVLYRTTFDYLPEMVRLAAAARISSISFEPLIVAPSIKELVIDEGRKAGFAGQIQRARAEARRYGISTNLKTLLEPGLVIERDMIGLVSTSTPSDDEGEVGEGARRDGKKTKERRLAEAPCFQPWTRMVVRPDGTVYPCCNFYEGSKENVRDRSLVEIWEGGYFETMRDRMRQGHLPEECTKCNEWLLRENRRIRRDLSGGRTFLDLRSSLPLRWAKYGRALVDLYR